MTAPQVRATVRSYYAVRDSLAEQLPEIVRSQLEPVLFSIEQECYEVADHSGPSRWAREMVGPVLAAALGATVYMREVRSATVALRMFGLSGNRPLSSESAWRIIQPYRLADRLSDGDVTAIRRKVEIPLTLSTSPTPVDVAMEMTRDRTGDFQVQVAQWLAEFFRENSASDTPFAATYRSTLAGLSAGGSNHNRVLHGKLTSQEWADLLAGRVPQRYLEIRAANAVVRRFVSAYWEMWQSSVLGTTIKV